MEPGLVHVQAFAGSEDPVVESPGSGQVGAAGGTEEKFAVARCKSPSIRLLRRQVQFDRCAKSPAVRPASSISSKIASAYCVQAIVSDEVGGDVLNVT